ncbi:MAG: choice-of-anchor tandem repeat GloVer-containing protein, partial [Candidatus Korobacteraceae bacterium]
FNLDTCIAAYEYPPVGGYRVLLSNFGGCFPFGTLIFDQAGNLYGTTFGGGGTVFELTQFEGQWNSSLLYAFAGTENENTGPLGGVLFDASGNLWGTTNGDGTYGFGNVFKLTLSHGSWIYTDVYDFTGGNDGGNPTGSLIADGSGNMYGTAMTGGANGSGVVFEITP